MICHYLLETMGVYICTCKYDLLLSFGDSGSIHCLLETLGVYCERKKFVYTLANKCVRNNAAVCIRQLRAIAFRNSWSDCSIVEYKQQHCFWHICLLECKQTFFSQKTPRVSITYVSVSLGSHRHTYTCHQFHHPHQSQRKAMPWTVAKKMVANPLGLGDQRVLWRRQGLTLRGKVFFSIST